MYKLIKVRRQNYLLHPKLSEVGQWFPRNFCTVSSITKFVFLVLALHSLNKLFVSSVQWWVRSLCTGIATIETWEAKISVCYNARGASMTRFSQGPWCNQEVLIDSKLYYADAGRLQTIQRTALIEISSMHAMSIRLSLGKYILKFMYSFCFRSDSVQVCNGAENNSIPYGYEILWPGVYAWKEMTFRNGSHVLFYYYNGSGKDIV